MRDGEKSIFNYLIKLLIPRRFQSFFTARKETLLYLFFGGLSFLLSVGTCALFLNIFSLNALTANLLSWLLTTAFVYVTNRRWVFEGERKRGTELGRQILAFYVGRTFTLLVEEAILAVLAVYLGFPGIPVKVFAQFVVILLNYIISKRLIFKKQR